MGISQYENKEDETSTRVDIFRYYGSSLLAPNGRRKLPPTPEMSPKDELTTKQICWNGFIRFLKFALHFVIVNVILFAAAVAFAFIEDPEHPHFSQPVVNQSVSNSGKYVSEKAFNDGNKTIFFLYMKQHYNLTLKNEEEQNEFLKKVINYQTAAQTLTEQQLYEKQLHDRVHIFSKWFYFVTVASTTIGYGDVAPKTENGRVLYIVFSIFGIPLMMSLLASCGDVMTSINTVLFGLINKYLCKKRKLVSEELLSAITIFLLLLSYIAVGCIFLAGVKSWSLVKSTYFWVVTFTTVGFGDVNLSVDDNVKYLAPLVVYRSFGLALLAGFIDSILAWIKVRREYFEAEAKRLKEANQTTLGATRNLLTPRIFKKKWQKDKSNNNGNEEAYFDNEDHHLEGSNDLKTSSDL